MNISSTQAVSHFQAAATRASAGPSGAQSTSAATRLSQTSGPSASGSSGGIKQTVSTFFKSVATAIRHGLSTLTHQSERSEVLEQRFTTPTEVVENSIKLQGVRDDMGEKEEAAEKMEHFEAIFSLVASGSELLESVMKIGSDIAKWNELSEKTEHIQTQVETATSALLASVSGQSFDVNGTQVSAENAINSVVSQGVNASSDEEIQSLLDQTNMPTQLQEGLKALIKTKVQLSSVQSQLRTHQVKTVATHTATATSVTKSIMTAVKTFGKHVAAKTAGAMTSAGAAIGLGVSVIKFGFDIRSLTRMGKSFTRASKSNPHLTRLMNSDKLSKPQKAQLSRLSQNIRRIGQKKVFDKAMNTLSSGAGIAAGVIAFAIAFSNPVGAGIGLAVAVISLGVVAHSMVRSSRHAAKIATANAKVDSFQHFAHKGIESLKQQIAANPTQKTAMYAKFGIRDDAHLDALSQLSTKKELALGYSLSSSSSADADLGAMEKLAQSVRPKMEEALVHLDFTQFQRELTSTSPTEPGATLVKRFNASKKGFVGKFKSVFRSDQSLFNSLKNEMASNMVSSATIVHDLMHDLQTRDEMAVDTQFRDVMSSLTAQGSATSAEQDSLVRFYSDISTSQGKELENKAFLTAPDHEATEMSSSFSRLMDLGE